MPPPGRLDGPALGRRAPPGGGGSGLPLGLMGARRGGGGIGLPESLSGGLVGCGRRAGSPAWGRGGAEGTLVADAAGCARAGAVGGAGRSSAAGAWTLVSLGATGRAELTRRRGAAGADASASRGASAAGASDGSGGAALAGGAAALVALVGFSGSSGCTSRRRPSASTLRRTRSACASSIDDEWLFTPMPRSTAISTVSLFVRPSSRASS